LLAFFKLDRGKASEIIPPALGSGQKEEQKVLHLPARVHITCQYIEKGHGKRIPSLANVESLFG
jgi:hypothetical protein